MSEIDRYQAMMARKLAEEQQEKLSETLNHQFTQLQQLREMFTTRKKHTYRIFLCCSFSYAVLLLLVLFQNYIFKGELSHDLILNLLIGAILFLACLASFLIAAAAPFLTFIFAASRGNEIHKALNEQITAIQAGTIHEQADFNKLEKIDAQKVTEIQEGIYWLLPRVKILRRINTLMCLSSVSMILCYFFLFSNFGFALPFSAMNFIIGSTSTIIALIFFLLSVALLAISGSQIFKFKINEY